MARISLLLSLAFVLALGSVFLSVSGHLPLVPPRKSACPKTVSELQTLPFKEITEILNRKERSAPKTAEFKAMFTMCKGYVAYLESLYKFENPIVDVLGIAKARYTLMTEAILAAQASVSGKINKKSSLKLKKSSADFTKGFLQIKETIVKISAKHQYNADAKITAQESKKLNHAMINFKKSFNAFMNVVCNLEKNKMKKIGHPSRALKEDQDDSRVRSAFESFFKKYGGYLGGKTHGRELAEAEYNANSHVGADVKGFESFYERFSHFFGGYLGGHTHGHGRELFTKPPSGETFSQRFGSLLGGKSHGRELFIQSPSGETFSQRFGSLLGRKAHGRELFTHSPSGGTFSQYFGSLLGRKAHGRELYIVGPAADAPAGAYTEDVSQSDFDKFFRHFWGDKIHSKAHGRELYIVGPDQADAPGGANADDVSQSAFDKYFHHFWGDKALSKSQRRGLFTSVPAGEKGTFEDFFGGKIQFDAAGKMKVAGESGFRSLNRVNSKHFASTEA